MPSVSSLPLDQLVPVPRVRWATPSQAEAVFPRHVLELILALNHCLAYQASVGRDVILSHAD